MTVSELRNTTVSIVMTFGRQFAGGLLQFGIFVLISYKIGAEGAGAYAVALMFPSMLSELLNLGLPAANIYFLSSRQFELEQVWGASLQLILLVSLLGLVLGGCLLLIAADLVFPGLSQQVLLTSLFLFPLMLIFSVILSFFLALQQFSPYNFLVITQPVLVLLSLLLLPLFAEFSLTNIFFALLLAYGVTCACALGLLAQRISLVQKAHGKVSYIRSAIRYGIRANLSNLMALLNYRLDLFLVNFIVGTAAAGIYTIAVNFIEQLWMISKAYSTVLFPKLSALTDNEEWHQKLLSIMAWTTLWITAIASILLAVLAEPLIKFFFGSEFEQAIPTLYLLLPGVVLFSSARVLANDLAARGKVGINLVMAASVLFLNTVANLLLIPQFGVLGAAVATTIAYTSNFLIRIVVQVVLTDMKWWAPILPERGDLLFICNSLQPWKKNN